MQMRPKLVKLINDMFREMLFDYWLMQPEQKGNRKAFREYIVLLLAQWEFNKYIKEKRNDDNQ